MTKKKNISLTRPRSKRFLAGVAAMIAKRLDKNPDHIRIAFIIATFVAGTGLIIYLTLWLLTPER